MKFLLDFVACCGTAPHAAGMIEPEAPLVEETNALVVDQRRLRRRRKRGRHSGARSGPASNSADWRPSLGSISEDNVAAMVVDRTAAVERAVKRKSGQDRTRSHVRSHSEDYGQSSFTAIPTFSATPFMF